MNRNAHKIVAGLLLANEWTRRRLASELGKSEQTVGRWIASGFPDDAALVSCLDALKADPGTRTRCGVSA